VICKSHSAMLGEFATSNSFRRITTHQLKVS
jgi:hypothetical protein